MPRSLEPNLNCPIILDWDKDKKIEEQPVIYTLSLSMRKSQKLGILLDDIQASQNPDELFSRLEATLAEVIFDWKNFIDPVTKQQIPYAKDKILDVFTINEAYEVIRKVLSGNNVSNDDQKKSE